MENLTIEKLLEKVASYDISAVPMVRDAYLFAEELHEGQFRQSGEPYISHPLNVAYILAQMHADRDTICAGLLHDVVEDRPDKVSVEMIEKLFNKDVAILVNGVTKISKINFSSKMDQNMANTRKFITSLIVEVRIILIKLADRLHNMRTLQYKSEFKQKENSVETMELFAPFANYIGVYRIQSELEDLSMKYLYPEDYEKYKVITDSFIEESKECVNEMLIRIKEILDNKNIPNEIKVRTKNIYRIYKRLNFKSDITNIEDFRNIHDMIAFKIIVKEIDDCYLMLRYIHEAYRPFPSRFKDFICNPKTNLYQSLHTTVFGEDSRLVQMQLRTYEMDKVASLGIAANWDINRDNAKELMQSEFENKCQIYSSLLEIDKAFSDNQDFVLQCKKELFSDNVYVYTAKGDVKELPKGSTVIDFAYGIHTEVGNKMVGAVVNDEDVSVDYVLKNDDRVRIITSDFVKGPKAEWEHLAKTTKARRKIREFHNKR